MIKQAILIISLFALSSLHAQDYYSELRRKYWEYEENDSRAFLYLDLYIASAKKEKNYAELFQAYDDAKRYSANNKLEYADSAIAAAKLSGNPDLIGNAHIGKGTVYYFNYRKFQLALDEYLKAFEYTKNAKNRFLKYQNLYHIGVVKSYLGYYKEALVLFEECYTYFEPNTRQNIHPNLVKNNNKGYFNSLHQMIICYQHFGNYEKANKLTEEGLNRIPKDQFFALEESYFYKSKGVTEYNMESYQSSVHNFSIALPELEKLNDFTWISLIYSYRGMSYSKLGNEQKALEDYKRVDSIFNKYQFILPEQRKNFEELISYYKKTNEPKQELYYTRQLLKADSIISTDFKYLATRIHKEYDTRNLIQAKADLENSNYFSRYLLTLSTLTIVILGSFLIYWFRRRKELQIKYDALLLKMKNEEDKKTGPQPVFERSFKLDEKLVQHLLRKFAAFEKNKDFLEKGMTAGKLASDFGTNATYLSQFMKEFKGNNFNAYLNKLRIDFATERLYSQKAWRRNSIEDIASDCGFSNRQSFSNLFYEQNGMRPAEFIKKRNDELQRNG